MRKPWGKPWQNVENHRKIMATCEKTWENHRKIMENHRDNPRKTIGNAWENQREMVISRNIWKIEDVHSPFIDFIGCFDGCNCG